MENIQGNLHNKKFHVLHVMFSAALRNLKVLNVGFNDITGACLVHLRGGFSFLAFTLSLITVWKTLVFSHLWVVLPVYFILFGGKW